MNKKKAKTYLNVRAKKGSRSKFFNVTKKIKDRDLGDLGKPENR